MPCERPQRVVYSVACSLDGLIADADGGVDWLGDVPPAAESGFDHFYAGVGSLVLGRATFAQVLGWGWPYGERPAAVLTSSPLPDGAPAAAFAASWPELPAAVARLREQAEGDVWVVGGAATAGALLSVGLLEEVELGVMPVLLGRGIALFPSEDTGLHRLELVSTQTLDNGVVWTRHRVLPVDPGPTQGARRA